MGKKGKLGRIEGIRGYWKLEHKGWSEVERKNE